MISARRRGALLVLGGVLALAVVLVPAEPAAAHASLVSAEPADGAQLEEAPTLARLTFSEPVSADLGGLRVFAADGERVDHGAVRVDAEVVEVDLASDLADGTYVVTYRVLSADGHPVKGGLVFSVGDQAADPSALGGFFDTSDERSWEIAGAVTRGIAYLGTLLAAGGAVFLAVVDRAAVDRRRLAHLVSVAAAVGLAGAVGAVPVQAALATGQGAGSLGQGGVLADVLRDGLGSSLAVGAVGTVLLIAGLRRGPPWLAVAGAAAVTGAFALVGHTRATDPVWLGTAADVVHVWAAATWFGGLVLLWWTLRAHPRAGLAPTASASVVSRFSTLAAGTVVAVGAAGSALAWSEVRTVDALTSTTYGWLLVSKASLVVAVGAIAFYNRFGLVPAMASGKATAALARLRRTVRFEAVTLVGALALTGILVNVTPARTAAGIGGLFDETVMLGDAGSVQVVVDPAQVGTNEIHLYTYDPDGRPTDIAESVTLELSLPAAGLGPITREPFRAGPAHLQLDGDELAAAGRWTIRITVRVDRFTEATGTVEVPVSG